MVGFLFDMSILAMIWIGKLLLWVIKIVWKAILWCAILIIKILTIPLAVLSNSEE